MATLNDALLDQKEDSRLCFLKNSHSSRKETDGGPSTGDNLLSGASTSGHSNGRRSWPRIRGILNRSNRVGESSRASTPAMSSTCIINGRRSLGLKLGSADEASSSQTVANSSIAKPTGFNKVKSCSGHAQQHQFNKIERKHDPSPLVKKTESSRTQVSRLSKLPEETRDPPKDSTSLFRRVSCRILERKQRTLIGTTQPLKDPQGLAKTSTTSRNVSKHFVKNETTQPPKNPTDLVENCGTSSSLGSKHAVQKKETAQPPKDIAQVVKDTGSRRSWSTKHVTQKKETTQPPKDPARLVKNMGTNSRSTVSMQWVEKKQTTQSPKVSAALMNETTSRIPKRKQFTQNKEKSKPSKGKRITTEKVTIQAELEEKLLCTYEDHIVWEGFDESIVPLGMSCSLCEYELAYEPVDDPDKEPLNPSENAVLSCGHVFHSMCLKLATSEENPRNPPCMICASFFC